MQRTTPPFRADHVGSLLRPAELFEAREKHKHGKLADDELARIEDQSVRDVIKMQEDLGFHTVTDGEFRRGNYHGYFFGRLIQAAVSRQREYLADASGVELTRNPQGLERALAKLAGDKEVLEVATKATAHFYIVNPVKHFESRAAGFMATHPPLTDRINRLRALRGAQPLLASEDRARE